MTETTALASSTATYAPFPEIVLLETNTDGLGSMWQARGSGVIIGPHTILTAAHMVWDSDTGSTASSILAYPGYDGVDDPLYSGTAPVQGAWRLHYNQVDNSGGRLEKSQSQLDFAVIDFATTFPTWFQMASNFGTGTVRIDGYPAYPYYWNYLYGANWGQIDRSGSVGPDPSYSVLDDITLRTHPGDSGGPLWYNAGTDLAPQNTVVGLVSTGLYGVRLTPDDISQINSWIASDSDLWKMSSTAATVTPTATDGLDFDAAYYLQNNPDVSRSLNPCGDPERHFLDNGWKEGRNPNQLFNTAWYLAHNPDVAAAGLNPLVHFATTGWQEGRDPSAQFSIAKYDQLNPDIAAAHIDPLRHYLNTGVHEGRRYT